MTTTASPAAPARRATSIGVPVGLVVILGSLQGLGPAALDAYLPALPHTADRRGGGARPAERAAARRRGPPPARPAHPRRRAECVDVRDAADADSDARRSGARAAGVRSAER